MANKKEFIVCSECFSDHGLKEEAQAFGCNNNDLCQNCKSNKGYKLNKDDLENLTQSFFEDGTYVKTTYGGFTLIRFNEAHYKQSDVKFPKWLNNDVRLIERKLKIGFFHHGPNMWRVGEVYPLKDLSNSKNCKMVLKQIIEKYPVVEWNSSDSFYRLRIEPNSPNDHKEYDSPPAGKSRFNNKKFPILYGSKDLEICMHECRVTVADELFVALLRPIKTLKLLDLTENIDDGAETAFESLSLAIRMLFCAEKHSYNASSNIALYAKEVGFNGILYPSYFNQVKNKAVFNVALFGHPIKENLVKIECINRLRLNEISYGASFGPIIETT